MYPVELEFKDTTECNTSASYLDLLLSIDRYGQFNTSIYDKRDEFYYFQNFLKGGGLPFPPTGGKNPPVHSLTRPFRFWDTPRFTSGSATGSNLNKNNYLNRLCFICPCLLVRFRSKIISYNFQSCIKQRYPLFHKVCQSLYKIRGCISL